MPLIGSHPMLLGSHTHAPKAGPSTHAAPRMSASAPGALQDLLQAARLILPNRPCVPPHQDCAARCERLHRRPLRDSRPVPLPGTHQLGGAPHGRRLQGGRERRDALRQVRRQRCAQVLSRTGLKAP